MHIAYHNADEMKFTIYNIKFYLFYVLMHTNIWQHNN